MKKKLANFIRVLLVFLIAASAVMCMLWLPGAVFQILNHLERYAGITGEGVSMAVYAICAVVIIPVFAIFFMSFAFSRAIENDTLFSTKMVKLLKTIGIILVSDCVLFCTVMIALLFLEGWFLTAPFLFIGVLGITVGCMLLVLSKYVKHAAQLKEEADCTL